MKIVLGILAGLTLFMGGIYNGYHLGFNEATVNEIRRMVRHQISPLHINTHIFPMASQEDYIINAVKEVIIDE